MANSEIGRTAGAFFGAKDRSRDAQLVQQLLNEHQAASILGIKVATLRRWRWAGKPPSFVKIGSAVRYDPEVLRDLIDAGRRNSTSDTRREEVAQ